MQVISIQSQVVHGHVGNSAAVYPLQAAGFEVAAVPTTLLSNHPHYPTMRGRVLEADLVADLLLGVEERQLPQQAAAILTGYMGSVGNASVVVDFLRRARRLNPDFVLTCDPVIGDDDLGVFVEDGLIERFRDELTPMADIVTPNQFELGRLVGERPDTVEGLRAAADQLSRRGTGRVVVTGCVLADTRDGEVETVALEGGKAHRTSIPRLPIRPSGTGDLFTAFMTTWLLKGASLAGAAERATRDVQRVLRRTLDAGAFEMRIIGD